jgi:hypothetical protein
MRTIALLFVTTLAHAAPAAEWSWLAGDWRRCHDGEIVEERWLGPRGEMMIGANLTSSATGRDVEGCASLAATTSWTFWAPRQPPAVRSPGQADAAMGSPTRSTCSRRASPTGAKAASSSHGSKERSKASRGRSNGASRAARRPTVRARADAPDIFAAGRACTT